MDEWVIQKMDFNRFLDLLSTSEFGYVHLKMVEGMPDVEIAKRMDTSITWLQQMKKAIRRKVEDYFEV